MLVQNKYFIRSSLSGNGQNRVFHPYLKRSFHGLKNFFSLRLPHHSLAIWCTETAVNVRKWNFHSIFIPSSMRVLSVWSCVSRFLEWWWCFNVKTLKNYITKLQHNLIFIPGHLVSIWLQNFSATKNRWSLISYNYIQP